MFTTPCYFFEGRPYVRIELPLFGGERKATIRVISDSIYSAKYYICYSLCKKNRSTTGTFYVFPGGHTFLLNRRTNSLVRMLLSIRL
jgi:hypothetical protein